MTPTLGFLNNTSGIQTAQSLLHPDVCARLKKDSEDEKSSGEEKETARAVSAASDLDCRPLVEIDSTVSLGL